MKILFTLFITFAVAISAHAQTVENDLVGLGMKPELADYLAGIIPAGAALDNNVSLKSDNQAGSGTVDLLKADTSDNTLLYSDEADVLISTTSAGDDVIITAVDDVVLQGGGAGDLITLAGGGTDVDLTIADNLITVAAGTALDVGAATAILEVPNGTDLPATCNVGEIFVDTDDNACADAGSGTGATCVCQAANTWVEVS